MEDQYQVLFILYFILLTGTVWSKYYCDSYFTDKQQQHQNRNMWKSTYLNDTSGKIRSQCINLSIVLKRAGTVSCTWQPQKRMFTSITIGPHVLTCMLEGFPLFSPNSGLHIWNWYGLGYTKFSLGSLELRCRQRVHILIKILRRRKSSNELLWHTASYICCSGKLVPCFLHTARCLLVQSCSLFAVMNHKLWLGWVLWELLYLISS